MAERSRVSRLGERFSPSKKIQDFKEKRVLRGINKRLRKETPHIAAMFDIFRRLEKPSRDSIVEPGFEMETSGKPQRERYTAVDGETPQNPQTKLNLREKLARNRNNVIVVQSIGVLFVFLAGSIGVATLKDGQSNGSGSGRSSSTAPGQVRDTDPVQLAMDQLRIPHDNVDALLRTDGINPTERLIVEPEYVQAAYAEFAKVVPPAFKKLRFPNGQTVADVMHGLNVADAAELSKHFSATVSNDPTSTEPNGKLTFNLTAGGSVMDNSSTNLLVEESFTGDNGAMLTTIELAARVINDKGDISGRVDTTADPAPAGNSFLLEDADTLVASLGFSTEFSTESLSNTQKQYPNQKDGFLTVNSNGLLEYTLVTGVEPQKVPDLFDWVAAGPPIQEAAVVVNAALLDGYRSKYGPVNVFDITRMLTGMKFPTISADALEQSLYTQSEKSTQSTQSKAA